MFDQLGLRGCVHAIIPLVERADQALYGTHQRAPLSPTLDHTALNLRYAEDLLQSA